MAYGQITRYIPGRGLIVIGLKIPDANPNFIYTPGKGLCPVGSSQQKLAKQTIPVEIPNCQDTCVVDDGGYYIDEYNLILDGNGDGEELDAGNANQNICG